MDEQPNPTLEQMRVYYKGLSPEETQKEVLGWLTNKLNEFVTIGVKERAITEALKSLLLQRGLTSDERPDLAGSLILLGGLLLAYPHGLPKEHAMPNAHILLQAMTYLVHEYSAQGYERGELRTILEGFARELGKPPLKPELN